MEQRIEILERVAVECAFCLDTKVHIMTVEDANGVEYDEVYECRRCQEER